MVVNLCITSNVTAKPDELEINLKKGWFDFIQGYLRLFRIIVAISIFVGKTPCSSNTGWNVYTYAENYGIGIFMQWLTVLPTSRG